jgi:hypothetical protein
MTQSVDLPEGGHERPQPEPPQEPLELVERRTTPATDQHLVTASQVALALLLMRSPVMRPSPATASLTWRESRGDVARH